MSNDKDVPLKKINQTPQILCRDPYIYIYSLKDAPIKHLKKLIFCFDVFL